MHLMLNKERNGRIRLNFVFLLIKYISLSIFVFFSVFLYFLRLNGPVN